MSGRGRNALFGALCFMVPIVTITVFRDWYDGGQVSVDPGIYAIFVVMFLGAWSASWLRKVTND